MLKPVSRHLQSRTGQSGGGPPDLFGLAAEISQFNPDGPDYSPATLDRSIFTPGPMVEDTAMRFR